MSQGSSVHATATPAPVLRLHFWLASPWRSVRSYTLPPGIHRTQACMWPFCQCHCRTDSPCPSALPAGHESRGPLHALPEHASNCSVNAPAATVVLTYHTLVVPRLQVMNRAARIAGTSSTGQVLASVDSWSLAVASDKAVLVANKVRAQAGMCPAQMLQNNGRGWGLYRSGIQAGLVAGAGAGAGIGAKLGLGFCKFIRHDLGRQHAGACVIIGTCVLQRLSLSLSAKALPAQAFPPHPPHSTERAPSPPVSMHIKAV